MDRRTNSRGSILWTETGISVPASSIARTFSPLWWLAPWLDELEINDSRAVSNSSVKSWIGHDTLSHGRSFDVIINQKSTARKKKESRVLLKRAQGISVPNVYESTGHSWIWTAHLDKYVFFPCDYSIQISFIRAKFRPLLIPKTISCLMHSLVIVPIR